MGVSGIKSLTITAAQLLFALVLYVLAIAIIGLAIYPGALLIYSVWQNSVVYSLALRLLFFSFCLALAYFVYGFTLILIIGAIRIIFCLNLKEGNYPLTSLGAMRWMFINALYTVVAITFMDFILLTPFAAVFYRLLGAKVGRNIQINSKYCADLSLLEIGSGSVIGGHATVICHSFERGQLILRKVKIGKNVVIGLNSVILPGAQIGDGAVIAAGAVLGKDKKVAPGSVYAGVPAELVKN